MTAKPHPGTLPGDLGVYAGRTLLGTLRPGVAGVYAFTADGKPLGGFPTSKSAMSALTANAARGEGADGD